MEEIRDHHKAICVRQRNRTGPAIGQELIEGVDLDKLQPRVLKDFLARDRLEGTLHRPVGPGITVTVGIGENLPVFIEIGVIDPPRIDPDAFDSVAAALRGRHQALADIGPQSGEIPIIAIVHLDGAVDIAVDFFQFNPLSVKLSEDVPSAGGSHINREIRGLCHSPAPKVVRVVPGHRAGNTDRGRKIYPAIIKQRK